ncbi:hypothetical protein PAXRUDRAFT_195024 [Paxillus rubicundulus Ve08.2h10]|uniref:Uncharacterized protein n=1 Tax=Paxillus rubicundulus Ve08.2h10 TaxID=930991 RepID=A0A0D0DQ40_9AGAM|nr:hypothetical protein PAXRUDRAFT_195024 [Paxillus rubicundulus Ve08.2h10]
MIQCSLASGVLEVHSMSFPQFGPWQSRFKHLVNILPTLTTFRPSAASLLHSASLSILYHLLGNSGWYAWIFLSSLPTYQSFPFVHSADELVGSITIIQPPAQLSVLWLRHEDPQYLVCVHKRTCWAVHLLSHLSGCPSPKVGAGPCGGSHVQYDKGQEKKAEGVVSNL